MDIEVSENFDAERNAITRRNKINRPNNIIIYYIIMHLCNSRSLSFEARSRTKRWNVSK